MANPFSDLGVSDAEFDAAMSDPEINAEKIAHAEKCCSYWKSMGHCS
jgi:hypothetical protein